MTTTLLTKTARTLVASTTVAAAGTVRSTPLSLMGTQGGLVTMKITNGATGPTTQCEGRVLIAHNATTPAQGGAGTDWKTLWRFGGGTTALAVSETSVTIDPAVMQLEIEFAGNTGQGVTAEAMFSEITDIQSS